MDAMNGRSFWLRLPYRLSEGLHLIGAFLIIPILTLLVGADVALRYLFNAPLAGANEIAGVMLLLILLFSLPFSTGADRHIKVDLLYRSLGSHARRIANLIAALTGVFVSLSLAWHSLRTVSSEMRYNESTLLLQIPYWPLSLMMGLIALLITVLFMIQMWDALRRGK